MAKFFTKLSNFFVSVAIARHDLRFLVTGKFHFSWIYMNFGLIFLCMFFLLMSPESMPKRSNDESRTNYIFQIFYNNTLRDVTDY